MKKPALYFSFLLSFLFSLSIFGQPEALHILELKRDYDLRSYLWVLATGSELPVDDVMKPAWQQKFVPYQTYLDQHYPGRKKGKSVPLETGKAYWGRIQLVNTLPPNCRMEDWLLFLGRSKRTTVYVVHSGGAVLDSMLAGYLVPAFQKDFNFGNLREDRVKLSLPPEDSITIFIKMQPHSKWAPWENIRLTAEDFYHDWNFVVKTQKDWMFIGFLLTFIFFSLLLFLATWDRTYLFHSLFQFGIFIYLLEFFYVLYDLPWLREHPYYGQTIIYLSLCGMDLAYLAFIRAFLNLKKEFPRWDKVFRGMIVLRLAVTAAVLLHFYTMNNMVLTDALTGYYMILQYLSAVAMLVFIKKSGVRRIFLVAGTLMFTIGVFLNAISVIGGSGIHFGYTQVGVLGEVLLFSTGLGSRMGYLMKEERRTLLLKEVDEFKTRFYTNITHEFRTPLTIIQGFANNLRAAISDPKQLESLGLIKHNSERLTRLVNRMLDLSKLQSGKMSLHLQQGNIIAFTRYLVFSFQSFAAGKGVRIRFLTELEKFEMDFDAEKMQDILTNLISNAIKFTESGGHITALVKSTAEGKLMIQVKDTGTGMTEEELKLIFERFYQSNSIRKKGQGSGLGLAITLELVKLMNGKIEVSSELGKGTVFTLHLPVTRLAPNAPVDKLAPIDMDVYDESPKEPLSSEKIDEGKPLALIVEDNYDVVLYIKQMLEKDYNVTIAFDGEEGIEKALSLVPDVIVSDVIMPEKDGLELCQTLKADERTSHIPIILATAKASVEDRLAGLQHGADAYLSKPFNEDELFLYLQNFILLRKKLQARYSNDEAAAGPAGSSLFETEDAFVSKVRKIAEEHLEDDGFGTTQLARLTGMSRSQLHRKITALTGHAASVFVNGVRLKKSKELLLHSDLNVSEIAYEVGLEPNYFSRIFKEDTGMTPTEFRDGGR
jgi:signal transduction histidine kinase/DNA-binding response OmpR family regulator